MVAISELDVHVDAQLRERYDVERRAQRADRSDPLLRPYAQLETGVRGPGGYYRRTLQHEDGA